MCPDRQWTAVFAVNTEKCACSSAADMIRATYMRKNILPFYVKLMRDAMMMIIIAHPDESARGSEIPCEMPNCKQTRMSAVDTPCPLSHTFQGPVKGGGRGGAILRHILWHRPGLSHR